MVMNGKNQKVLFCIDPIDPLSFCSLKAYESAKPKDLTEEQSEKLKKFLDEMYNKKETEKKQGKRVKRQ